ncbi:Y-family DNA polymerase [Anaeromyxobacter paludicola]|uniref:Protein ImuB n=1 Tax=Anaeromyxobacter paludicola TaxID=2918171 RepID=A0ABM7X7G8_9BACT|nr:DNA polymerase Y family protein [Anaeromyxobacter paludicola]BDG07747.1 protein ImuB [Anaeromyxobacter paludicola]
MQLELAMAPRAPRVLALHFPALPLQRALAARGGAGGPAALVRDGKVALANGRARAAGVLPGSSAVQAEAACAGLLLVAHDEAADRAALVGLAEAMLGLAPAVEPAFPEALLLDASGAHLHAPRGAALLEAEGVLAARARALAAGLGFRCRAAVASGRGVARALARSGREELVVVPRGQEAAALAALPLAALELPAEVEGRLAALGLRDVGGLARLPEGSLAHRFGPCGPAAARLARGEDPSPLTPHVPRGLPSERAELEAPVEAAEPLLFVLRPLAERVAARLAGQGLGASRLELVLRLDPRGEERLAIPLARPGADAAGWLLVLRERLAALTLPAPVASLALAAVEAVEVGAEQLALDDRPEVQAALETVLSRLAARFGDGALFAAEPVERWLPEGTWRAVRFAAGPARAGGGAAGGAAPGGPAPGGAGAAPEPADGPRPTRLLSPPRRVVAEGEGGRLTAVRLGGRVHAVASLTGPERLSGEWWSDPFHRDYYRARLEGLGDCWLFEDGEGALFLHGFFD